ncbi:MAG TPA: helix-turn-helix transcriptional regulator [Firmicutes bacterium]|nr:helix-turn-helix transcriptional regulator [Bacillota bacterium]
MVKVGSALRQARLARGLRQQDVCKRLYISDSTLSEIERCERKPALDVATRAARELDDPVLYAAVATEATGGVMVPVWLDGEKVDLHRSSVRDKAVEELSEAIERLAKARAITNAKRPEDLDDEGRRQVEDVLHELVEAQTACGVAIVVLCRTYGFSIKGTYQRHVEELRAKGYVRKEGRVA